MIKRKMTEDEIEEAKEQLSVLLQGIAAAETMITRGYNIGMIARSDYDYAASHFKAAKTAYAALKPD